MSVHFNLIDVWVADHLGKRKVGVIERRMEDGLPWQSTILFHYLDGLSNTDAISLLMPVRRETYRTNRSGLVDILHPVFDQNLPEGALRAYLEQHYRKVIPDMGDFDLLRITGKNSIGRLRFAPHESREDEVFEEHPSILYVSEILDDSDSEKLLNALFERLAPWSGVSGVQPKVLLTNYLPVESIIKPSRGRRITMADSRYIVKTSGKDYPWLALNEYLCLHAAKASGLDVPNAMISGNGQVLIVDRFDVHCDGASLGFEDGCSLMGLTSRGKYIGSYEMLAKTLTDFLPPANRLDTLKDFFHSIAFSCAIENGDAHLKNFGLLYLNPEQPPRLAPTFDLVCTTAYIPEDHLALSMAGSKSFPGRETLINFGKHCCQLSTAQIKHIFDEIAEGVNSSIDELNAQRDKFSEFSVLYGTRISNTWTRNLSRLMNPDNTFYVSRKTRIDRFPG